MSRFATQQDIRVRGGQVPVNPVLTSPSEIQTGSEAIAASAGATRLFGAIASIKIQNQREDSKRRKVNQINRAITDINNGLSDIEGDANLDSSAKLDASDQLMRGVIGNLDDEDTVNKVSARASSMMRVFKRGIDAERKKNRNIDAIDHNNTITADTDIEAHLEDLSVMLPPDEFRLHGREAKRIFAESSIDEISGLASQAESAEGISELMDAARQINSQSDPDFRLSSSDLETAVLSSSLRNAALNGDPNAVEQIAALGPNIPKDRITAIKNQAQARFDQEYAKQERQIAELAREQAFSEGTSNDKWRQTLVNAAADGRITQRKRDQLISEIQGRQRGISVRVDLDQKREKIYESAQRMALDSLNTGGLQSLSDFEVEDLNKNPVKVSADSVKKIVVDRVMQDILTDDSLTSEQKRSSAFSFMERNDVVYEPWQNRIRSLSGIPLEDLSRQDGLPDAVENDLSLLRQMNLQSPKLVNKMVGNDQFVEFFLMLDKNDPGNTQRSAVESHIATLPENRDRFSATIKPQEINAVAEDLTRRIFRSDIRNIGDVQSSISALTKFTLQRMRVGSAVAAEHAAEQFSRTHQVVNNWYVNTAAKPIPEGLTVATDEWINQYVDKFGESEGIAASDLSVIPNKDGTMWQLVRMDTPSPTLVENVADGLASSSVLMSLMDDARNREIDRVVSESQDPGITTKLVRSGRDITNKFSETTLNALSTAAVGVIPGRSAEETARQKELAKDRISSATAATARALNPTNFYIPGIVFKAFKMLDKDQVRESIRRATAPVEAAGRGLQDLLGKDRDADG